MAKLNTSNPDHFIYENDMLQIEVLGGIKVEGLDRMRATLPWRGSFFRAFSCTRNLVPVSA